MIRGDASQKGIRVRIWLWTVLLILLLSVGVIQCSINKPTLPTWNLKLTVPLVNKHYDMATLIGKMDEEYLKVDSLGNPFFYFEEDLDTTRLTDKLRCDSTSIGFKDTLGPIMIRPSESREIGIQISDFYPGGPGYVPPCSITVREDCEPFEDFSQVSVQEAFGSLEASNYLGLDLNFIQIGIIDQNSQQTLHTVVLPGGIADGNSASEDIVLQDMTFSNQLSLEITFASPGGEVQSLEDKFLSVNFTLDSLRVVQGQAKVPSLELSKEETLVFPTGSVIDSAEIRSGSLMLHLSNFTNLGADVQIDFPELDKNGEMLSATCNLPATGSRYLTLVFEGCTLRPINGNEATIQSRVHSAGSGDAHISFTSSDSVIVEANLSEIAFSQVSGVIESTTVEIDSISRELDVPQGFESAQLVGATLSLEIHNGVDLPANLSVDIQGDKGQNLSLQAEIEAGSPFGTAVTSVQEDDLGAFLSPVPERITVTGEIVCGDGQTRGTVRENDFVFGVVRVSSPLELIWDSCQVEIDSSSDEVDQDARDLIQDQLNSGKVVLKVENHLPLGAEAKISFSRDQGDLFSQPDLVIGPVEVPVGELNHDGSVKESSFSEIKISLSYDDLQVFTSTPFYMTGYIDFPGSEGKTIRASAADFVKITSYLELSVKNKKD